MIPVDYTARAQARCDTHREKTPSGELQIGDPPCRVCRQWAARQTDRAAARATLYPGLTAVEPGAAPNPPLLLR